MPLREYKCSECGHTFEYLQLTNDEKPTQCAICGSGQIQQILSAYGGYSMDSGPSSVRPRRAGSFKRHK